MGRERPWWTVPYNPGSLLTCLAALDCTLRGLDNPATHPVRGPALDGHGRVLQLRLDWLGAPPDGWPTSGPEPGQDLASVLGGGGQLGSAEAGWPRYGSSSRLRRPQPTDTSAPAPGDRGFRLAGGLRRVLAGNRQLEDKKRPERPASVPDRSFKALRPGRGADPRYPLGPPLMLSPVALPGNNALDGISDLFPLADPSGREEP